MVVDTAVYKRQSRCVLCLKARRRVVKDAFMTKGLGVVPIMTTRGGSAQRDCIFRLDKY